MSFGVRERFGRNTDEKKLLKSRRHKLWFPSFIVFFTVTPNKFPELFGIIEQLYTKVFRISILGLFR